MEENKTPTAGILRIPCRGFSLPYDGAIDWVGSFLHVPRKCHIWHRAANTGTAAISHPLPPHIKNNFFIPLPRPFSGSSGRWRA